MDRKRFLQIAVTIAACLGLAFACSPFIASLFPSDAAKAKDSVKVPLSALKEHEATEVDWHGYKVFVVNTPEVNAFLMPYWDDAYRLPDPTWEQPLVPCKTFTMSNDLFSCADTDLHPNWQRATQWDFSGNTINKTWVPNLRKAPFTISGGQVVISQEYR